LQGGFSVARSFDWRRRKARERLIDRQKKITEAAACPLAKLCRIAPPATRSKRANFFLGRRATDVQAREDGSAEGEGRPRQHVPGACAAPRPKYSMSEKAPPRHPLEKKLLQNKEISALNRRHRRRTSEKTSRTSANAFTNKIIILTRLGRRSSTVSTIRTAVTTFFFTFISNARKTSWKGGTSSYFFPRPAALQKLSREECKTAADSFQNRRGGDGGRSKKEKRFFNERTTTRGRLQDHMCFKTCCWNAAADPTGDDLAKFGSRMLQRRSKKSENENGLGETFERRGPLAEGS